MPPSPQYVPIYLTRMLITRGTYYFVKAESFGLATTIHMLLPNSNPEKGEVQPKHYNVVNALRDITFSAGAGRINATANCSTITMTIKNALTCQTKNLC